MNDNDKSECPCAVCAIGRIIDEKLSDTPKNNEVRELFRGLAVGVAYVAGLNSDPANVVRAFLGELQYALNKVQIAASNPTVEVETLPPANRRH